MVSWRAAVVVTACLMIAPALAGCAQLPFGGDDSGADAGDGTDGDEDDGDGTMDDEPPVTVSVTLDDAPGLVETGDAIQVDWSVGTSTGEEIEIPHTAVHWADRSVDDPGPPSDYGNTSGAVEPATVPGTFQTELTIDEATTIHLRAHAVHNGTDRWSDEVEIQVQEAWDPTIHTIEIGNSTPGIQADYSPSGLEIEVGDGIEWVSRDPTPTIEHTATSFDDAPESFDTGRLAQGDTSEVFYFNTTGTYRYFCDVHGRDNMQDEFTVVEG